MCVLPSCLNYFTRYRVVTTLHVLVYYLFSCLLLWQERWKIIFTPFCFLRVSRSCALAPPPPPGEMILYPNAANCSLNFASFIRNIMLCFVNLHTDGWFSYHSWKSVLFRVIIVLLEFIFTFPFLTLSTFIYVNGMGLQEDSIRS